MAFPASNRCAPELAAFTLAEVAVALGIFAFGVVSILGLAGAVGGQARLANEDTRLIALISDLDARVRAREPVNHHLYFDADARFLSDADSGAAPPPAAFFHVELVALTPAGDPSRNRLWKGNIRFPAPGFGQSRPVLISRFEDEPVP